MGVFAFWQWLAIRQQQVQRAANATMAKRSERQSSDARIDGSFSDGRKLPSPACAG
jgi:hypothetical protein